jgi:hypothetical protein
VDKRGKPMMQNFQIAIRNNSSAAGSSRGSINRRIRAFLNGESHGTDVLGQLYGDVADEPVPESLRALIKR